MGDWVTNWIVGTWRGYQVGWIVGVLAHASTAMLGVLTGQLLRSGLSGTRKVVWMTVWGIGSLGAGLFWSGWVAEWWPQVSGFGTPWTEWPVWCPIIKNRWTSSYVLYAGGWSLLLLAAFYLVIDVLQWRRWALPFVVIGANSIFAYMCWQLGSGVFRSAAEVLLGRSAAILVRSLVRAARLGGRHRHTLALALVLASQQDVYPRVKGQVHERLDGFIDNGKRVVASSSK